MPKSQPQRENPAPLSARRGRSFKMDLLPGLPEAPKKKVAKRF